MGMTGTWASLSLSSKLPGMLSFVSFLWMNRKDSEEWYSLLFLPPGSHSSLLKSLYTERARARISPKKQKSICVICIWTTVLKSVLFIFVSSFYYVVLWCRGKAVSRLFLLHRANCTLIFVISRGMLNWQTMDTYPSSILTNTVRADKRLAIQTDRQ